MNKTQLENISKKIEADFEANGFLQFWNDWTSSELWKTFSRKEQIELKRVAYCAWKDAQAFIWRKLIEKEYL